MHVAFLVGHVLHCLRRSVRSVMCLNVPRVPRGAAVACMLLFLQDSSYVFASKRALRYVPKGASSA